MRQAVQRCSLVALGPALVGLCCLWLGSRSNYGGACVGVCVRSLLALIGLGVALVAAPLALAGMLALRARDWLALPVLLGGALLPAGGALYVLAAERTSLALTGGVGINANLVPVALLAPLVLVPLLALLYGALEPRRTPTRRALGRCASCA